MALRKHGIMNMVKNKETRITQDEIPGNMIIQDEIPRNIATQDENQRNMNYKS
jgi:hypothetical protein